MNWTKRQLWERFQRYYTEYPSLELALDLSRVEFPDDFFAVNQARMDKAFAAMAELVGGGLANTTEKRRVGHYWLRQPELAPEGFGEQIRQTVDQIRAFARDVHTGALAGAYGPFKHLLLIGIGGSALGPQFVAQALGHPLTDKLEVHFFDNTDPDGMDKVLARLSGQLGRTLCVVVSKSGETKETRNGMLEAANAYQHAGLRFGAHAVAITRLDKPGELLTYAQDHDFLHIFPLWEWVGGRTSETSAVGLLPAALQGLDIDGLLAGARTCDEVTRRPEVGQNPAAQLALMWHHLGRGKGEKDMVVIPYKDRLELFSRYLQQLVMESLGKAHDLHGEVVHQGLAVYGNKGSTDQHAYVQQLRDGVPNFFVVFLEVLKDRASRPFDVEPGVTSGDYLSGFLQGTRTALFENGRQSITITVKEVSAFSVGVLIALFERAVGFYATLVNVNAYDQPGVQAGKEAADDVLFLQKEVVSHLAAHQGEACTVEGIASAIGQPEACEAVFKVCEHLAANPGRGVTKVRGGPPAQVQYSGHLR